MFYITTLLKYFNELLKNITKNEQYLHFHQFDRISRHFNF